MPIWDVNQQLSGVINSHSCVSRSPVDFGLQLNACEFVGALVDASCDARTCADGTFCPSRCYSDSAVYGSCPTRLEKLKNKKEQT